MIFSITNYDFSIFHTLQCNTLMLTKKGTFQDNLISIIFKRAGKKLRKRDFNTVFIESTSKF